MNPKTKKSAKIIKTVCSVIWWIMLILLVFLMIRVFSAKAKGKVPTVFGYSVVGIISGSMEPEIPVGSYILIKETEPEAVKKNDIICFYSADNRIYGLPNTHRVADEPIKTENGIEFVTRGDANPANDTVNAYGKDLIGVYVKRLDGLTAFSNALSGGLMIVIIAVLFAGIVAVMVLTAFKTAQSESKESSNDGSIAPVTEGNEK